MARILGYSAGRQPGPGRGLPAHRAPGPRRDGAPLLRLTARRTAGRSSGPAAGLVLGSRPGSRPPGTRPGSARGPMCGRAPAHRGRVSSEETATAPHGARGHGAGGPRWRWAVDLVLIAAAVVSVLLEPVSIACHSVIGLVFAGFARPAPVAPAGLDPRDAPPPVAAPLASAGGAVEPVPGQPAARADGDRHRVRAVGLAGRPHDDPLARDLQRHPPGGASSGTPGPGAAGSCGPAAAPRPGRSGQPAVGAQPGQHVHGHRAAPARPRPPGTRPAS